jgi:hypothetical protein
LPDDEKASSGKAVPADDLPDDERPPTVGEQIAGGAKQLGVAGARLLAHGAINIAAFIPDMAAGSANEIISKLPKGAQDWMGGYEEMPSSFFNRMLDQYLPGEKGAGAAEEVGGAIIGGAPGMEKEIARLGSTAAEKFLAKGGGKAAESTGVRGFKPEETAPERTEITTKAAEDASIHGYNLSPAYIGGRISKDVQTVSGGPKVHAIMSKDNEPVTDNIAKHALGQPKSAELSPELFQRLKNAAYEKYAAVRKLGKISSSDEFEAEVKAAGSPFYDQVPGVGKKMRYQKVADEKALYMDLPEFDSNWAVSQISGLRADSGLNLKSTHPEDRALGFVQRQIANALENRLEKAITEGYTSRHVTGLGFADQKRLVADFKEARRQLAIIHVVEDSMGPGGHVRASDFAKLADAGVPLSEPLMAIARTAKNFPKDVQLVTEKGETGDFSAIDFLLGGTGAVSGHAALVGLGVSRAVSRSTLRTEAVQKEMIRNLRAKPGPIKKAAGKAYDATKATAKPLVKAGVRGGVLRGGEARMESTDEDARKKALASSPDLGQSPPL